MEHLELVLYFQYANAIEEYKAAVTIRQLMSALVARRCYGENL